MARQQTDDLKYYSRDTKMQENEQYIEAIHPIIGFYILEKLRMHIYGSKGYYCEFKPIHKQLFCKNNGNISIEDFDKVLQDCFLPDVELFDKELYDKYQILTSDGIQKRWKKIATEAGKKNKTINPDYCLIEQDEIPVNHPVAPVQKPANSPNNSDKQELTGDKLPVNGNSMAANSVESTQIKQNEIKQDEITIKQNLSGVGANSAFAESAPSAPVVPNGKKQGERAATRRKNFVPPAQAEVTEYFLQATAGVCRPEMAKMEAQKYFSHYSANGWVQNKDKPIVDWKAAVHGWLLRLFGESDYKIEKGVMKKVAEGALIEAQQPDNMDKRAEFLYQKFLHNQVKASEVDDTLYTHLIDTGKLKITAPEKAEIKEKSRQYRIRQLEGSNERKTLDLCEAYRQNKPDDALVKADERNFLSIARAFSVLHYFAQQREQGKGKLN